MLYVGDLSPELGLAAGEILAIKPQNSAKLSMKPQSVWPDHRAHGLRVNAMASDRAILSTPPSSPPSGEQTGRWAQALASTPSSGVWSSSRVWHQRVSYQRLT